VQSPEKYLSKLSKVRCAYLMLTLIASGALAPTNESVADNSDVFCFMRVEIDICETVRAPFFSEVSSGCGERDGC